MSNLKTCGFVVINLLGVVTCFVTGSDETVTGGFSLLGKVCEIFRFVIIFLMGFLNPAHIALIVCDIALYSNSVY